MNKDEAESITGLTSCWQGMAGKSSGYVARIHWLTSHARLRLRSSSRNATVKPLTMLGHNSQVAFEASITSSVIGNHAQIGASSRITDSFIFDNAVVGEGCIISDTIVGEGAIVKKGSVLLRGCVVGPGAVVGEGARLERARVSAKTWKGGREGDEEEDKSPSGVTSEDGESADTKGEYPISFTRAVSQKQSEILTLLGKIFWEKGRTHSCGPLRRMR